jgi:hypothetical protein
LAFIERKATAHLAHLVFADAQSQREKTKRAKSSQRTKKECGKEKLLILDFN